jgi:DNA invertase Pin-like site-specific DNA recombinase
MRGAPHYAMPYHTHTRKHLKTAPSTLGVRLGRLAIRKQVSVQAIAEKTGASRTTVYNWFSGGGVTNAYKDRVLALIQELQTL